jgi:LETM1 and EF-hand domain-containing protein 1
MLGRFCRDYDGKVTPEEVASAAIYLKDTLGKEGIQELISNLSKDKGTYLLSLSLSRILHLLNLNILL